MSCKKFSYTSLYHNYILCLETWQQYAWVYLQFLNWKNVKMWNLTYYLLLAKTKKLPVSKGFCKSKQFWNCERKYFSLVKMLCLSLSFITSFYVSEHKLIAKNLHAGHGNSLAPSVLSSVSKRHWSGVSVSIRNFILSIFDIYQLLLMLNLLKILCNLSDCEYQSL